MKFSVSKAIDTDLCDSTVVIHNALVIYFTQSLMPEKDHGKNQMKGTPLLPSALSASSCVNHRK